MKKKFLSSLLFAALVGGAVSTFTACKDYDDDINSLQSKLDGLSSSLGQTKTELEKSISNLKEQLEKADGELKESIKALDNAVATKADKTIVDALQTQVNNLQSKVIGLETRIETLETAQTKLADLIKTKADQTTVNALDEKVQELYADIIAAGGDKLGDKLKGLLKNEFDALKDGAFKNLELQLEAISKLQAVTGQDYSQIGKAIKELQAITADYDVAKYGTLKGLADKMSELSTEIDKANKNINILTVLCGQQLRSLVFQPQAYYWGIEATRLYYLKGVNYTMNEAKYNVFETQNGQYNGTPDYGYQTYNRWPSASFDKVLDFVAKYHMNPSTANLDPTNANHSVGVVYDDKDFVTTRASQAGLSVKNWETKNGDLIVNLQVANAENIKHMADDKVTVFAAQAHLTDTTITSDYATIIKKHIQDVKIYHKVADATVANGGYGTYTSTPINHPVTGVPVDANKFVKNTPANNNALGIPATGADIPSWDSEMQKAVTRVADVTPLTPSNTLGPVIGTVKQTVDYFTQDWVRYDLASGFDLKELVCTRVFDGTAPIEVDPEELGLKYKFELTALHLLNNAMVGDNGAANTSESAHAAINGDIFRPQMVQTDGTQAGWNGAQGRQTIGRTPVVRVSLVDDAGKVYDYGYIRILIVDKPEVPPTPEAPVTVEYTGKNWEFAHECNPSAWDWEVTWAQVEYDIYKNAAPDMSRDEFLQHYFNTTLGTDGPELMPGSSTEFQQYVKDANGQFVKATAPVGVVFQVSGHAADGTETSTLKWTVSGNQALANFTATNKPEIAVRYVSDDKTICPDIYVVIKPGVVTIHPAPVAEISWDALKNPSYWYADNSNVSATEGGTPIANAIEMHNNVLTPEDNNSTTVLGKNFRQTVSATMLNNEITGAKLFQSWTTAPATPAAQATFAESGFKTVLVFSEKNNGKEYKGESGATYKMIVKGNSLEAYKTTETAANSKPVAQLVGTDANNQKIVYGGNTAVNTPATDPFDYKAYGEWEYAKDLLNYKAHNALDANTIRAIIGVNITAGTCNREVKHNDATIDVRFLRPINVANAEKEIEDGNTTGVQTVNIIDLVSFTDWREAWKPAYVGYYGIKSVSIDGVETTGDNLSNNVNVLTNQAGNQAGDPLKTVNAAIDFIYTAPATGQIAGTLTYKNFSSTVDKFWVKIPVTVEYFWGKIHTTATVNVKRTHQNAPGKK